MPELLPLTAADCATSTSETTSENQRKSKFAYRASGGQTARIPGITRFSIPVHTSEQLELISVTENYLKETYQLRFGIIASA